MKRKLLVCGVGAALLVAGPPPVFAETTVSELEQRLDKVMSIMEQQQREIERLREELQRQREAGPAAPALPAAAPVAKVEAKDAAAPPAGPDWLPKWVRSTKLTGDLRLRYEGLYNRDQRQADRSLKEVPNRDRFRLRARLFVDSTISDEVSTHFMICTNQDGNREATTTNQSLTDDFNDKGIFLHRAYATYMPKWLEGLEITAGKFKNTFMHTDIMWDPDVNPEGIYERFEAKVSDTFTTFTHLGQMAVNEVNTESDDAALFISQWGFDWKLGKVAWTLGLSYYNWINLQNSRWLHTAQYKAGGGNTFVLDQSGIMQYRYDYDLMEVISFLSFKVVSIPTKLTFDYIYNDADNVPGDQDTAYYLGFDLGSSKKKGDWTVGYKFARIEKDALVGSLNDQDFYGANREGHKIWARYQLLERLSFGSAFFSTDPVTDWDPASLTFTGNDQNREHEDRLQVDMVFKF